MKRHGASFLWSGTREAMVRIVSSSCGFGPGATSRSGFTERRRGKEGNDWVFHGRALLALRTPGCQAKFVAPLDVRQPRLWRRGPIPRRRRIGYLRLRIRGTSPRRTEHDREPHAAPFANVRIRPPPLSRCAGAGPHRAPQEAPPTAVIVVDGSGSMWGNLGTDKRPKLEMVRESLRGLLPSLRTDARIGLASFGHRRRGNCGDAEVIVPPDASGPERMSVPVDKVERAGQGADRARLARIRQRHRRRHAGKHRADRRRPRQLRPGHLRGDRPRFSAASPNLVIHTIALGFDKPKLEQISCIAQQTGGKLWDAQDAAGFASALSQAVNLANLQSAPSAPAPEPAAGEAAAEKPRRRAAGPLSLGRARGEQCDARQSRALAHHQGRRRRRAGARHPRVGAVREAASPGPTRSRRGLGLASARQTVEVAADARNAGAHRPQRRRPAACRRARPTRPRRCTAPIFTVTPASADAAATSAPLWVGREAHPEIVLPAGDYTVTAENGVARQQSKVTIAPATGTNFNSMLESGLARAQRHARHGRRAGRTRHRRCDLHPLRRTIRMRRRAAARWRARPRPRRASRCPPAPTT